MKDVLKDIVDWVGTYCPAPLRGELIAALNTATAEDGSAPQKGDFWRVLAEILVAKGEMATAREAIKRWQLCVPADHPVHALMGGPPPAAKPEPRPNPIPKREDPTERIVRVIDNTYTFYRIDPEITRVGHFDVVACWECYLDEKDVQSRACLNELSNGTVAPWAVTGVFTDFAGAAAVEIVVRSMQRHFVFSVKKAEKTRKILANFALPGTAIIGVLAGYLMGVL